MPALAMLPRWGFAEDVAAVYADAAIDWKQFAGQTIALAGAIHPWSNAITPLLPEFTKLTGINVVTDCGAYVYTASREWRNRFRSTAFHNVVQVDDEEVNRFISPDSLWQLQYDAHPVDAVLTRYRVHGLLHVRRRYAAA